MSPSQASLPESTLRYVKGVGPRRLVQLQELGIATVEDACYYAPRRYEDRTRLALIQELKAEEPATVRVKVLAKSLRRARRGRVIVEIAVGDASGVLYALWFNQPYLAQQLKVGEELFLYGHLERGARRQMIHPELERVEEDEEGAEPSGGSLASSEQTESKGSLHMGRIVPIYPLTAGVSQRWLRQVVAAVLERHAAGVADVLPDSIRRAKGWPELPQALREFHFPSSREALAPARGRLAFEELFLLQIGLAQRRADVVAKRKPQRYDLEGPLTHGLRERLPFALTPSQQDVLAELLADLAEAYPMHRLLQGDVGCGKTILMIWLMAVAVQSGFQAALMAPTELLAEQHARVVGQLLGPLGVNVGLISQGVPSAERARRIEEAAQGRLGVALGTHALIERSVTFKKLALVIIDEQHKFGVAQRAHLARKAQLPDVLVVTATPIPRTLALTLYGDLQISTITHLPPGRAATRTLQLGEAERETLQVLIRDELRQGRQGYVVYPLVKERAASDLRAATDMAKRLQRETFPEYRIGLLHGQMKPPEKEAVMRRFVQGELHLLVSTVIVEVGLDVPNATIMVIEHPERFGLAQLHQLRGRIGRSSHPAICVVVSDAQDEAIRQRLRAFVGTSDGFQLAEQDLEQRGPGELRGGRQSGWLRFRVANLVRDRALLEAARQEATALVERDPQLQAPELEPLRRRLARLAPAKP